MPGSVRTPRWVLSIDGAVDGALVAFAGWTLWYEVALWQQWSLWWAARVWIPLALLVVVWSAVTTVRRRDDDTGPGDDGPPRVPAPGSAVAAVVVVATVLVQPYVGVLPLAVAGLVLVVGSYAVRARTGPHGAASGTGAERAAQRTPQDTSGPGPGSHLVALAGCLALAVLASLMVTADADDAYYVNRATWVAQHGLPVTRDTMFGPASRPSSYGGGLPLPSVEALQGALAHALGLSAPDVVYLVTVPVLSAAAGWVTWRLVRSWAGGWHLAVLLVALAFPLLGATSVFGNYFVGRIWQGKVMALVLLLPLVWLHLGRLAERRDRRDHWSLWMLGLGGVAFVGLTSTAALLGPVVMAGGLLAAVVTRSRWLALGAVLLGVAPVVSGLVVAVGSPISTSEPLLTRDAALEVVFGSALPLVALGVLGLVLGPVLVRGRASAVAAAAAFATLFAFLPGVFELVDAVTGAGPVIWRLAVSAPVEVLVGLLVTWPLRWPLGWGRPGPSTAHPRAAALRTGVGVVVAAGIAATLVLAGTPLWSSRNGAVLTSTPAWKQPPRAVANLRALPDTGVRDGPWLLPPKEMIALSSTSTRHFAVVPRIYYLPGYDESQQELAARTTLFRLVAGRPGSVARVRAALRTLDVSVACVLDGRPQAARTLTAALGRPLEPVGSMHCDLPRS